jgi:hypothetical protein
MKRLPSWTLIALFAVLLAGCSGASIRSQSPEETTTETKSTKLVGNWASPYGMHPVKIEAVGLMTGLVGTGSDPPPGYERSALLNEMQTRGVENPNQILASGTTSVVLIKGFLRPGIQKGDRFDVEVRTPARSETSSLRGGWVMETRLREVANIDAQIHTGQLWALCEGPVMIDPSADGSNAVGLTRGRLLGGGVALRGRTLGLVLRPEHQSVPKASRVGDVINQRFHTFIDGAKKGVANPKNNEYIELRIHPRYQDNVARYMQVIQSIALRDDATSRLDRLKLLERQLLDPITADAAALRLEAIGPEAIPTLKKGIESTDPLVRFYAAESLAYLDETEAAEPLAEAARTEPAFRLFALTALSAMDDFAAYEALAGLLSEPSAETRYGAFRSLWAMNAKDPLVRGENLGEQFGYHVLRTEGPAMIHLTRSYRPEVVVFGVDQHLDTPLSLEAGKEIIITGTNADQITVSRFSVGKSDEQRVVTSKLDDLIRAVVELGGTYPDVVQFLQEAKRLKVLPCRLEVDALPEADRLYVAAESDSEIEVQRPVPNLFPKGTTSSRDQETTPAAEPTEPEEEEESPSPEVTKRRPLSRVLGRIKD